MAAKFLRVITMNKHFFPANILLPKDNFQKWSVIACDQYTSEPNYWEAVKETVQNAPSALNIILPEVYLSKDNSKAVSKINENMQKYLNDGVFDEISDTFVYVERTLKNGQVRRGIVGLIDLNDYSYIKGEKALIRATEATVLERIPPRVEIRRDAPIEMPHIMLLIDDINKTVIEPLSEKCEKFEKLYDFSLMQDSGSIKGFAVKGEEAENISLSLEKLIENTEDKMLFAVGDGNHSLATAKECYAINKTENSRYALVEIVNIHDESLQFEPIYRVIFNVNPENLINDFVEKTGGEYNGADAQKFTCIYGDTVREISIKPTGKLAVATLQKYLDENPQGETDYIHGEDVVYKLCKAENTVGFIFSGMQKDELFDAVKQDGALPRKTFSMGHAEDKRFYLEARKL